MPIFNIICTECGKEEEILCKHSDLVERLSERCECGGERVNGVTAPYTKFVGQGWESNDHFDVMGGGKPKKLLTSTKHRTGTPNQNQWD